MVLLLLIQQLSGKFAHTINKGREKGVPRNESIFPSGASKSLTYLISALLEIGNERVKTVISSLVNNKKSADLF